MKLYPSKMADNESFSFRVIPLCFLVLFFSLGQALNLECIEVKREYVKKGFSEKDVPIQEMAGDHLSVCEQSMTCCTSEMESKLRSLSTKEYDNVANEAFRFIKSTFNSRTKKFDDFFVELLENSKNDLDEMFVRTYGPFYKRNAEVFLDLFRDLKSYYKGQDVNLVTLLNNFFQELSLKMFTLLNRAYEFDDGYLGCVSQHMDALKPFGDVPTKLKLQVKRAFIAARTFVQGLAIGRDVIHAMEKIPPTEACTRGLMRMMYCPHCRGLTSTKPCNNYCLNTMKGCLAKHSELNKAWNEYIEALKLVALRLEGPFNIETVVGPMDVEISEAIMNLQEASDDITNKIFKGCGQPRLRPSSREEREANPNQDETDASYEQYQYGSFLRERNRQPVRPTTASGTSLDRLVRDIKVKVKEATDFWVQLPYTICNSPDFSAQPDQDGDCWNGQERARYVHEVQKDGRINQANNPEVTYDAEDDLGFIKIQIKNLKIITGKLQNAYNGIEVVWDDPKIDIDGSGYDDDDDDDRYRVEGSGQPGGNRAYDDNDEDDDLDGSGSGSGAGVDSGEEVDDTQYPPKQRTEAPGRDFGFDNNPVYRTPQPKPDDHSGGNHVLPSVSSVLVVVLSCFRLTVMWL